MKHARALVAGALTLAVAGAAWAGQGPVTGLPMPRYVSLKSDKTNVRRGPSENHRVDWEFLRRGMPVRVVAEHDAWRRVQDIDGVTGWVHSILLSGVRTAIVTAPETTLRKDPAPEAQAVAIARQGVIVKLDECGPAWCHVDADGHDGWTLKADMWGVDAGEVFE